MKKNFQVESLLFEIKSLMDEAENHRVTYTLRARESYGNPREYWNGRRDEAGHFRDRLAKILKTEQDIQKNIPWINKLKKQIAFWVWRNLAGTSIPFYNNPKLEKYKAPTAPSELDWFGYKLAWWNLAVKYLVSQGELSYTPALRGKF